MTAAADDYTFAAAGPVFTVSRGAKVILTLNLAVPLERVAEWFRIDDRDPLASYEAYLSGVMLEPDVEQVRKLAADDGVLALVVVREWADALGARLPKLRAAGGSGGSIEPNSSPTSGEAGESDPSTS